MSDYIIPFSEPFLGAEEERLMMEALKSKWISSGPFVSEFESGICQYTGSPYALAVCNGTAALHLALWGVGVKPEDEVIVPSFTFIAPASVSKILGAKVRGVDVCPRTWCIDPQSVVRAITSKTKAIVAVHLYGNIANMDELLRISLNTGIPLIEDAAEAFGSQYGKKYAGTMGRAGIFSFHATKNLTTGEGGMVLTSDHALYEKMFAFREHGMKQRKTYWHDFAGHNFRLTNLQAALGCAQLDRVHDIVARREKIHKSYLEFTKEIPFVTPQRFDPEVNPVLWAFCVLLNAQLNGGEGGDMRGKRNQIIALLADDGIESRPGFYPLKELPPFCGIVEECPTASYVSERTIALPTYTQMTQDQIKFVVERLNFHAEEILK